jgi:hypothetical protein
MVATRLDARVESRSEFVNRTELVTGLGEPPGGIGHDQHPLGIWIHSSRSWT